MCDSSVFTVPAGGGIPSLPGGNDSPKYVLIAGVQRNSDSPIFIPSGSKDTAPVIVNSSFNALYGSAGIFG